MTSRNKSRRYDSPNDFASAKRSRDARNCSDSEDSNDEERSSHRRKRSRKDSNERKSPSKLHQRSTNSRTRKTARGASPLRQLERQKRIKPKEVKSSRRHDSSDDVTVLSDSENSADNVNCDNGRTKSSDSDRGRKKDVADSDSKQTPSGSALPSDEEDGERDKNIHQTSISLYFKPADSKTEPDAGRSSRNSSARRPRRNVPLKSYRVETKITDSEASDSNAESSVIDKPTQVKQSNSSSPNTILPDDGSQALADICSLLKPRLSGAEVKILDKLGRRHSTAVQAIKEASASLSSLFQATTKCLLQLQTEPNRCFSIVRVFIDRLDQIRLMAKPRAKTLADVAPSSKAVVSEEQDEALQQEQHEPPSKSSTKQITKLEKTLRRLEREIIRYDKLDVDWCDEECSTYIIGARLKRRYVQVYSLYCKLIGAERQAARVTSHRRIRFEGTRFPEINQRIAKFVNRTGEFPDFRDVLSLVSTCNQQHGLHLSKQEVESQAREAFRLLGAQLQRARRAALVESMDCLSGASDWRQMDPSIEDAELNERLTQNAAQGEQRICQLLEQFTRRQQEGSGQASELEAAGDDDVADDENADESEVTDEELEKVSRNSRAALSADEASELEDPENLSDMEDMLNNSHRAASENNDGATATEQHCEEKRNLSENGESSLAVKSLSDQSCEVTEDDTDISTLVFDGNDVGDGAETGASCLPSEHGDYLEELLSKVPEGKVSDGVKIYDGVKSVVKAKSGDETKSIVKVFTDEAKSADGAKSDVETKSGDEAKGGDEAKSSGICSVSLEPDAKSDISDSNVSGDMNDNGT